VRKLFIAFVVAGGAAMSAPAMADDPSDDQRDAARKACAQAERCREARRALPWFYRGPDEEAQSRRRSSRRSSED
jgi:hypothetical protein